MVHTTLWMNLKIGKVKEARQKAHCIIPFTENFRKFKLTYSNRKQILKQGEDTKEGGKEGVQRGTRKLLGVMDMFTILIHGFINMFKMCSFLCVNYISIKIETEREREHS